MQTTMEALYIADYAQLAFPIYRLTGKKPFIRGQEQQAAFDALKKGGAFRIQLRLSRHPLYVYVLSSVRRPLRRYRV